MQNDETLLSNPLAIRTQTTSEGDLTEFKFNWFNANSVCTQLMRNDLHSMCITFVAWIGLLLSCGQASEIRCYIVNTYQHLESCFSSAIG